MIIETLQEQAIQNNQAGQPQGWPGYWRISKYGGCLRASLAEAAGEAMLSGKIIPAEEGRLHEADLVRRLRQAGHRLLWTGPDQQEVKLIWAGTDWNVIGHPDGLIDMSGQWYLLELKSKDREMFQRLLKYRYVKDAFPVEYAQVQGYMAAVQAMGHDVTNCLYIAKQRGNGQLYEEIIRFDPYWLDRYLYDDFSRVIAGYQAGASPSSLPCHSDGHVRRWCSYRYACEGPKPAIVKNEADAQAAGFQDQWLDLAPAIERWRDIKRAVDELESEDKEIRGQVESFMRRNKLTSVVVHGVNATIVRKENHTLDKGQLVNALNQMGLDGPAILRGVTKEKASEYLRMQE